ncbi:MAG: hypothetical protein ACK54P_13010, partial [Bacteroidota bacterium]
LPSRSAFHENPKTWSPGCRDHYRWGSNADCTRDPQSVSMMMLPGCYDQGLLIRAKVIRPVSIPLP